MTSYIIVIKYILENINIKDWSDEKNVLPYLDKILHALKKISQNIESTQNAFLLQPIWKTIGKSPILADNCLDVFFWSDSAFTFFIADIGDASSNNLNRQNRSSVWLYKMLYEINQNGNCDHKHIIDTLSYNTKNDKAFASSGRITNKYMKCERLKKPIITKDDIKKIILNNSEKMLSPERRFDSIISNTPDIFGS